MADESLTFIQEIQENFFEPLIGKKQNKKPNKHYFSHYYRVTRTYRGGSVLMLRSGGRFKGSHFKHKALVNIKITAKNKKIATHLTTVWRLLLCPGLFTQDQKETTCD